VINHVAVALKGLGRTAEAMNELTKLLQGSDESFRRRDEAARLLEELRSTQAATSG
jgi:hypothetical protein